MTSEIAVMNQRAIALAADSAVTLYDGGKVIVRNDQRKLFQLAQGLPVGMMFFGVADIMGHPWEVLLEHFQKKAGGARLPHARDYAAKFTGMLDGLEAFFPRERQADEYKRLLASVYRFVFGLAQYLHEAGGRAADRDVLRQAIELVWLRYQHREDGSARRDLACFPPGFADTVKRDYAGAIEELIAYGFGSFNLDADSKQRLRDIGVFCVVKDLFLEDITGLVVAGYGEAETYPVVVTTNVSAVVNGIVKRAEVDVSAIDTEMKSAITLFADSEVTYAFLRGIELDLEARIYGTLQGLGAKLVEQLVASFTHVDPAEREAVRRQFLSRHLPDYLRRFHGLISEYQQHAYIDPILKVVELSPKQELAETARDLVALNIFKKKIMAQRQTVGGAIDVAVISRDAGFNWVKRQGG
ncbi:MAG TPA: hypothetical protein VMU01_08540 [Rhizomicrobium sp.]|nr:hypothetical protein [Rhizomicrobium sp.]